MIEILENKALYKENNKILGEIDYPNIDNDTVNITHTYVDESLRGQGIADQMMQQVIKYLKQNNKKVICTCSYALKWLEKHPEYHEVITKKSDKK